jgi:hypothetical protein
MSELRRAAIHESAHAVAALHFALPLREVFIRDNGSGGCGYTRRLGWGEIDRWIVSAYSGPLAERAVFGDADEDGDLKVIRAMLRRLGFDWTAAELAEYRRTAGLLVEREQHSIEVLADELLRRRSLTADAIGALLSATAGGMPLFGAPMWVSP